MPTDRPIDGIDQTDVSLGKSAPGHREKLLSLIGPKLVAVRWRHSRIYFTDPHATGEGPQRLGGIQSASGLWPVTRSFTTSKWTPMKT
jgi:hypothetical protein